METNRSKRTLFIVSSLFPPHLGGVERYTASLARTLSRDFQVTVICMNTEGMPEKRVMDGVTVWSLGCVPLFSGRLPLPTPGAFRRFRAILSETPIDAALIQTRLYPLNVFAVREFKRRRIPTITIEHGTNHVDMGSALVNCVWRAYEHGLAAIFRRTSSAFFGVSAAAVRWLSHFGIEGKGVIPNGVEPADFDGIRPAERSEFGLNPTDFAVVFAGRLLTEKGVLDLAEAVRSLGDPAVKLVFAGCGSPAVEAKLRGESCVAFVGTLDHSGWLRLLASCDVLCLPTRYPEGLPTVILESGMLGIPVIASDAGGIVEVVRDEVSGRIVRSGDVGAIAAAIAELKADPELRRRCGASLRETVRASYTWDRIAAIVRAAVDSLTAEN